MHEVFIGPEGPRGALGNSRVNLPDIGVDVAGPKPIDYNKICNEVSIFWNDWESKTNVMLSDLYGRFSRPTSHKIGPSHCMDPKEADQNSIDKFNPSLDINSRPNFVGGKMLIVAFGEMMGVDGVALANRLYEKEEWTGLIHTDCGFVKNLHHVNKIMEMMLEIRIKDSLKKEGIGEKLYEKLKEKENATHEIELIKMPEGRKAEIFVVNDLPNSTFNRPELHQNNNQAYLGDIWKLDNPGILAFMKENVDKNLTQEEWRKRILLFHFVTLKVLDFDLEKNVVHLK